MVGKKFFPFKRIHKNVAISRMQLEFNTSRNSNSHSATRLASEKGGGRQLRRVGRPPAFLPVPLPLSNGSLSAGVKAMLFFCRSVVVWLYSLGRGSRMIGFGELNQEICSWPTTRLNVFVRYLKCWRINLDKIQVLSEKTKGVKGLSILKFTNKRTAAI